MSLIFYCKILLLFIYCFSSASSCCYYCKGSQEIWITSKPSWKLVVEQTEVVELAKKVDLGENDKLVTDFRRPAGYLTQEAVLGEIKLYNRYYNLSYAGIPIYIQYKDLSKSSQILSSQYIELDFGINTEVSGFAIQNGFYEEKTQQLLFKTETWTSRFIASYAAEGQSFRYVTEEISLQKQIFVDSKNEMRSKHKIYTFDKEVTARKLRIHPIDAFDQYGPTNQLMVRVSPILCNIQGKCPTEKIHCQMSKWSNWGSCQCNGDYCVENRMREIHRYSSCGGQACEHTREKRTCTIPSDSWKLFLGIGLGVGCGVLVIGIIGALVYKLKFGKKKTVWATNEGTRPIVEEKRNQDESIISPVIDE
ncbi:DgyrCDS8177 [Dimorphilus gyrociliatus]|uniref:DgyrCDS8177 n=1 Tax=Dimorphilus gyrociliatus TaxID=2664684 RepID=A0A7I8VTK7_9ANNE|nr:DgyrCDS8177 [Dimorphilus gyrociliatus]